MPFGMTDRMARQTVVIADEMFYNQYVSSACTYTYVTTAGGTTNNTYCTVDSGTLTTVGPTAIRAIQELVTAKHVALIETGEVFVGDCIFYFPRGTSFATRQGLEVTDALARVWTPVADPPVAAKEYMHAELAGTELWVPMLFRSKR